MKKILHFASRDRFGVVQQMQHENTRKRASSHYLGRKEDKEVVGNYKSLEKKVKQKFHLGTFFSKVSVYLFELEDGSYLFPFRLLWGIIMIGEIWNLIQSDYQILITRYFLNPYYFNFKYYPFYWVELMRFDYMKIFVWLMLIAAIFISFGFLYRTATVFFFFGISYLFLLDSINYLNHMYLVCVMSAILIFIPCNQFYSVDCYLNPLMKRDTVPK